MGGKGSGRRPKPDEQKRRLGNPGKRRLGSATVIALPSVGSQVPEPSRPLGVDGLALWERMWRSGAPWLRPDIDGELMLLVCELSDERRQLRGRVLRDFGEGKDVWRLRAGLRSLDQQITNVLAQLGFSPTDRAGLGVTEVQSDGFAELRRRIEAKRANASG